MKAKYATVTKPSLLVLAILSSLLLTQCSDDPEAPSATSIVVVSGNNQLSLKGTTLPELLVVAVKSSGGTATEDVVVDFSVIEGGGSVSPVRVATSSQGQAATQLTLGPDVGINQVRASVSAGGGTISTVFTALSANFYCEEANDTLKVCEGCPDSYGSRGRVFLATTKSALFDIPSAGIVNVNPYGAQPSATEFVEIPVENFITTVVWDIALSARGDLFLARRALGSEIVKISTGGSLSRFAHLEAQDLDDAVEIDTSPAGLVVGVDKRGPFLVECQDVITRFGEAGALYTEGINTDAMAVDPRFHQADPLGEDIYFINTTTNELLRLPMDSLRAEAQGVQVVTGLTIEEANGARGMVCDDDGTVFILVNIGTTKEILRVTPGGLKSVEVDFSLQPGLPGGGHQSDLAIDRGFRLLYTLDTLNNYMLLYNVDTKEFFPTFANADSLERIKLSGAAPVGERVGLVILPAK